MKRKGVLWIFVILVVGGLIITKVIANNKSKYIIVKTSLATKGNISSYLSTTAVIKSRNINSFYGLQGLVKKVYVKEGDKVKKGDTLITYDIPDLSSTVRQAELQYENAKLQRQEAINQSSNMNSKISDEKLEQLDNSVELAELNLKSAKDKQSQSKDRITSSIDGTVTDVNAVEGSAVSNMQPAIIVQDTENLKVEASLGKYDASKIKLGQEAIIKNENKEYKGKVSFIEPAAKKVSGLSGSETLLGVDIDILEKSEDLKIDFDTDVDILLGKVTNAVKIPNESIKTDKTGRNMVFVVEGSKVSEREIKVGLQSDTETQVLQGLTIGEKVILNPSAAVKAGSLVKEDLEGTIK